MKEPAEVLSTSGEQSLVTTPNRVQSDEDKTTKEDDKAKEEENDFRMKTNQEFRTSFVMKGSEI